MRVVENFLSDLIDRDRRRAVNRYRSFPPVRRVAYRIFLVSGFLFASHASALKPFAPTAAEVRMLPPYCAARLGAPGAAASADSWKQRLGAENYLHVHHYCYALNFMNRSRVEANKNDRKYYLQQAVNNFDYVLKRWSPTYQLSGSAKTYKLQAESMLRMN